MARKNKYSRLKPKVSPLTYILLSLFFIGLVLTIVLSIDTPKQSFNKRFELDNHNFELNSFKKVQNKINNDEEIIVIIQVGLKSTSPKKLLKEIQNLYNEEKLYDDVSKDKLPNNIIYVEVKDNDVLTDFIKEYEIKKTSSKPLMLAFKNNELLVEYDSEHVDDEREAEDKEKANLINNVKTFFKKVDEEF